MVAHACGLRFPHIPYPVCIGRLVDCLSGAVPPVNVPEPPTIPPAPEQSREPASRCRQCWVRSSRSFRVIAIV